MGSFYTITLVPPIGSGKLHFSRAEVSEQSPFPLVRVLYSEVIDESSNLLTPEKGLRLDLDKQVFIDHFDDELTETNARDVAPQIADYVVRNMRSKRWQQP